MSLIRRLKTLAGERGGGRGIHLEDAIFGLKAGIAFEASAPLLLILANRELENLSLVQRQRFWKEYFIRRAGLHFYPAMRDAEAFLDQNQVKGAGKVRIQLGLFINSRLVAFAPRYGEGSA